MENSFDRKTEEAVREAVKEALKRRKRADYSGLAGFILFVLIGLCHIYSLATYAKLAHMADSGWGGFVFCVIYFLCTYGRVLVGWMIGVYR